MGALRGARRGGRQTQHGGNDLWKQGGQSAGGHPRPEIVRQGVLPQGIVASETRRRVIAFLESLERCFSRQFSGNDGRVDPGGSDRMNEAAGIAGEERTVEDADFQS